MVDDCANIARYLCVTPAPLLIVIRRLVLAEVHLYTKLPGFECEWQKLVFDARMVSDSLRPIHTTLKRSVVRFKCGVVMNWGKSVVS